MTTSIVFLTFDYVVTIWYSHLHVLISELIQSGSALNQRCSALKIQCFTTEKISAERRWFRADFLWSSAEFFSSEQRWFSENQSWSALKQSWSVLMFIMFSESPLKSVKTMKQRCSALTTSGTSTRAGIMQLLYANLQWISYQAHIVRIVAILRQSHFLLSEHLKALQSIGFRKHHSAKRKLQYLWFQELQVVFRLKVPPVPLHIEWMSTIKASIYHLKIFAFYSKIFRNKLTEVVFLKQLVKLWNFSKLSEFRTVDRNTAGEETYRILLASV